MEELEGIELGSLPTETKEKLLTVLKEANQVTEQKADLAKVAEKLGEVVTTFSEQINKRNQEEAEEIEAEKFDKLSKERVVETWKSLPANDPGREIIKAELAKEFGISNTELLLEGTTLQKAISRPVYAGTKNAEDIVNMQKAWDFVYLNTYLKGGIDKDRVNKEILVAAAKDLMDAGYPGADLVVKGVNEAMDTATATEGLEWIPTNFSARMHEDVWLSLQVAPIFPHYRMSSKMYSVPIRTARSRGYRVAEATTNAQFFTSLFTAHNLETDNVDFTAEKLGTLTYVSAELEQDSIIDVLAIVREDIQYGLAECIDDAILNGSTGATLDGALWTGTTDARSAWDGIRSLTGASAKVDGSTFELDVFRNTRKAMLKYGINPDNLVWIVSPQTYIRMLSLGEVLTLEKYGPNATVLTGELGRIDGIRIIVSPNIYTNLNNTGVYDGVTTDKTVAVLVHKRGFAIGDRREVRINSDYSMLADQNAILTSVRMDFQKMFATTEPVSALAYRLSL